jgi:Dolichyl-phosphate-mannose-protein mannosyltransferase
MPDAVPPGGGLGPHPGRVIHRFRSSRKWTHPLPIAVVWLLGALYVAQGLKRGWVPADEGFAGQSAERVLHGELPHREYSEGYTGGLTFLNAAAFRIFGTNLASPRYMLFLFFLLWVPAFFYAATHFVSRPVAAAVTLLAVAWSVPNYSAAMPSWYNLFFATFGLGCGLRYIESQRRRWLFLAGLCAGISCLFKITGLYFIAGVLLFFLFRERVASNVGAAPRNQTNLYRVCLVAGVLFYEILIVGALRRAESPAGLLYFWLPEVAVGAAIIWFELSSPQTRGGRFSSLFRELAPFAAGLGLPLAIFLGRYVAAGSQSRLLEVLTVIARQLDFANAEPPPLKLVGGVLIDLLLIAAAFLSRGRVARIASVLFFLGIPAALLLARTERSVDRAVWSAIWTFLPVVVTFGAALLLRDGMRTEEDRLKKQKIFLVLSVTAACSLIQFPYTIGIYFCYVAPLVFLAAAAVGCLRTPPRWAAAWAMVFCLAYAVLEVTPGFIGKMGEQYSPDKQVATLTLPRAGGLRVSPSSARIYEALSAILKQHARGEYIYATPDCPEVYFLYGFRNPTATLFDLNDDPVGRTERILRTIRQHDVNLVVLNLRPEFSGNVPPDLRTALEQEFPNRVDAEKFEVRWRP